MAGGEQTTEFRMRPGAVVHRHKYIRGCCIAALVLLVIAIAAHGSALETFLRHNPA